MILVASPGGNCFFKRWEVVVAGRFRMVRRLALGLIALT